MIVQLEHGQGTNSTFEVFPVSERVARKLKRQLGREPEVFVQTDWDYPSLAQSLGWNFQDLRRKCQHYHTDGTVDCPNCGKTASEFISEAYDWLSDRVSRRFRVSSDFFGY